MLNLNAKVIMVFYQIVYQIFVDNFDNGRKTSIVLKTDKVILKCYCFF